MSSKLQSDIKRLKKEIKTLDQQSRLFRIAGMVATLISFSAYIPAIVKVIQNPSAIANTTFYVVYTMNFIAAIFWLVYAIGIKKAAPLVIYSVARVVVNIIILGCMASYSANKNKR